MANPISSAVIVARNRFPDNRLIVDDEEYAVGIYTNADLPDFIHGAGSVEVLVGPPPPPGTLFLMR